MIFCIMSVNNARFVLETTTIALQLTRVEAVSRSIPYITRKEVLSS